MSRFAYLFDAVAARQVLDAMEQGNDRVTISVDLNRSRRNFAVECDELILDQTTRLGRKSLRRIASKPQRVFSLQGERLEILEARDDGYYKLVPTDQAPLLEISGVKMHISKGISPFDSASRMAAQVVRKGSRILDTCSGLGYAAIAARTLGARQVVTVEKSPMVIALRAKNPWSDGLMAPEIHSVEGNINSYIVELETASFDGIIHDPPRFSLAGELYGEAFYRQLYRILKRRGRLFHYTGNPGLTRRGSGFVDDALRRLKAVGFREVTRVAELMGVVARK